jgi:sulfite reductase alpha subunit-like flavoprotein
MYVCLYVQINPTVKSSDFRSTRFLQFDLASDATSSDSSSGGSTGTQLKYETGDHAVIIPKNDKQLVKELCDLIDISPYQWFTVTGERVPFQLPARVGQVFEEELDLATNKENLLVCVIILLNTLHYYAVYVRLCVAGTTTATTCSS